MKRTFTGSLLALALTTASVAVAQQNTSPTSPNKGPQDKSAPNEKASAKKSETPVVLTVTTVAFAESTGCWVKIYDGHNYSGRTLTLMGAQSLPHLEFGAGFDWEGDIDSIVVGPKAKLTLYEDELYVDRKGELKPNEKVADLHKSIASEGVESLMLSCTET